MSESIRADVGRLSVNEPDDVTTVQRLLNKVPKNEGRPPVPLEVDGACGNLTCNAIWKFQHKQFGYQGADGRIQPNRQTWIRLRTLTTAPAPPQPAPPAIPVPKPKPQVPPEPPEPKSLRFSIVQPGPTNDLLDEEHEFFFRLSMSEQAHTPRVYWLGPRDGYKRLSRKPKFTADNWFQRIRFEIYAPARHLGEFECEAFYLMSSPTRKAKNGERLWSKLVLRLGPRGRVVNVPMYRPLVPKNPTGETETGRPIFARRGWFQLVKNPSAYIDDDLFRDLPIPEGW